MADKRIHDSITEITEYQDKNHDFVVIDGDGLGTSQDKAQKMTFDNLASSIGKLLNNANDDTATLTNKTIDADDNTFSNIINSNIKALAGIDATKIADGSVSNAEFQYLDGVTSSIQDQIDAKASSGGLAYCYSDTFTASGTTETITHSTIKTGINGFPNTYIEAPVLVQVFHETSAQHWSAISTVEVETEFQGGTLILKQLNLSSLSRGENYYVKLMATGTDAGA